MDNLVTCPYNPCHQIRKERIQYHLLKCAKVRGRGERAFRADLTAGLPSLPYQQHPHMPMVICPYNASHHVPVSEEAVHIASCKDRRIVELQK